MDLIDTNGLDEEIRCEMCKNPMHTDRGCDGNCKYDEKLYEKIMQILGERIKSLPSAQPDHNADHNKKGSFSCNHENDLISRTAAIEALSDYKELLNRVLDDMDVVGTDREKYSWGLGLIESSIKDIEELPPAQPEPSEITDEQAILHLRSTGWMQNHDREMYESGLREKLADDSGSYDSLIPCEDAVSRQAAIDAVMEYGKKIPTYAIRVKNAIEQLPPAQPERMRERWQEITASDCSGYDPALAGYDDPVVGYVCSVCHEGYEKEVMGKTTWDFCPNCGADMRENR